MLLCDKYGQGVIKSIIKLDLKTSRPKLSPHDTQSLIPNTCWSSISFVPFNMELSIPYFVRSNQIKSHVLRKN